MKLNKKKIFLIYIKFEAFRNRGAYWIHVPLQWLSTGTLRDAFLLGGMAKLTVFTNLSMYWLIVIVFIAGILMEFIKASIGYLDFKLGMWKTMNEWHTKNQVMSPYNVELRETLEGICEKVGAKSKFKDV